MLSLLVLSYGLSSVGGPQPSLYNTNPCAVRPASKLVDHEALLAVLRFGSLGVLLKCYLRVSLRDLPDLLVNLTLP